MPGLFAVSVPAVSVPALTAVSPPPRRTTAPMVPRGRAEAGCAGGAGPRRAHGRAQVRGAGGHGQRGGAAAGLGGAHHQGRLGLLRQVRAGAGRARQERSDRSGAASGEPPPSAGAGQEPPLTDEPRGLGGGAGVRVMRVRVRCPPGSGERWAGCAGRALRALTARAAPEGSGRSGVGLSRRHLPFLGTMLETSRSCSSAPQGSAGDLWLSLTQYCRWVGFLPCGNRGKTGPMEIKSCAYCSSALQYTLGKR